MTITLPSPNNVSSELWDKVQRDLAEVNWEQLRQEAVQCIAETLAAGQQPTELWKLRTNAALRLLLLARLAMRQDVNASEMAYQLYKRALDAEERTDDSAGELADELHTLMMLLMALAVWVQVNRCRTLLSESQPLPLAVQVNAHCPTGPPHRRNTPP